jgi:hypothetical protein
MVRRCFPVAKIEGSSPSGVVFQYFFLAILTFFPHPPAESAREHPCFFLLIKVLYAERDPAKKRSTLPTTELQRPQLR